jgi:hypothetical protein
MAAMLAHAALMLSIVVRLYDAQGIPAGTLATARATVDRILHDAGITVTWTQPPYDIGVDDDLIVRIVKAPAIGDADSLGFSYIDVEERRGTLATIFADRIATVGRAAGLDQGELLGRAMAHEIGHLLLGTREHAAAGLMRGKWTSRELTTNRPTDWQFSRKEGARARQAVVRRVHAPEPPRILIAGGEVGQEALSAP